MKRPDTALAVLCEGGPWDGWGWFADDWENTRRAAERMDAIHTHRPRSTALNYRDTGHTRPHPRPDLGYQCAIWTWTP